MMKQGKLVPYSHYLLRAFPKIPILAVFVGNFLAICNLWLNFDKVYDEVCKSSEQALMRSGLGTTPAGQGSGLLLLWYRAEGIARRQGRAVLQVIGLATA